MSFHVIVWVLDHSEERLANRLVLLALAQYAHKDGSNAFPKIETLMKEARLSRRQVQASLRSLEANGSITCTGVSERGTHVYSVLMEGGADFAPVQNAASEGADFAPESVEGPASLFKEDLVGITQKKKNKASTEIVPHPRIGVIVAWRDAPGMISHRPAYYEDPKIRGQIDRAIAKYEVDGVQEAIRNYAVVVHSGQHYFNHRWTLGDFLGRGLDRFVSEAEPLKVFLKTADRMTRAERKSARIQSLRI